MRSQVWRSGRQRGQAAEGAGGGEPEAEEALGRADAGTRGDAGTGFKKVVTPAARREAVAHLLVGLRMSEQQPCRMLGCCRMTAGYQTLRVDDAALREGKTAMAHKRRRFGYRRIHFLLRRQGHASVVLPSLVNIAVVNVAAPKISFLHAVATDRESV
jgi:putative transposase